MKIFGLTISRSKGLQSVSSTGTWFPMGGGGADGWWPLIEEPATGAWQTNTQLPHTDSLSYWAVFRCVSMISSDIAKMDLQLMQEDSNGIEREIESPAFSPVLRKPNKYQNRIQFIQNWLESKLKVGNAYILLARDGRDVVTEMYVLDPCRVRPLVSDEDGSVFYELRKDYLSDIPDAMVVVPASEIIHDRWNTFYHPLVGLSPIFAAGITALMGRRIQSNSAEFFGNSSQPAGILTAPGLISDETAKRLQDNWRANYSGAKNVGKIAVVGDGLKFEPMRMSATDAQLIEQLKWTDAMIAGAFGIPAYMINAGNVPAYNNVEALTQQYYSQCLQILIEAIELGLKEGLTLPRDMEIEFDLDDLLRMDTATQISTIKDAVQAGVLMPNEGREKLGYPPGDGGDELYMQQQMIPLSVDRQPKPVAPAMAPPSPDAAPSNDNAAAAFLAMRKGFGNA